MEDENFDGSFLLEKLASIGLVDDFYNAVDSDDLSKVKHLLKLAGVCPESIQTVLNKIRDGE